jgi:preprotein translocase subunit SecE
MNNWTTTLIWSAVVGGIFAILWWQGYVVRFRDYVMETRVELEKCTWPSWEELKGSTLLIAVSILLLGVFTVGVDRVLFQVVLWLDKI